MLLDCVAAIPTNPDINGIGIRVAIYVQNFLSFAPAFFSLINDGKVDLVELKTVEKQSTTILITAFAILISLIVQARTFTLSGFHTAVVLNLSWMNNTNTFIYFLLYIHHKSDPEQENHIAPRWSAWVRHVREALRRESFDGDIEMIDLRDSKVDVVLDEQSTRGRMVNRARLKKIARFFRKIVLSLGSLHLTVMAVIGIWFWSSPVLFETRQPQAPQSNSLNCTSMALLGTRIAMSSSILRAWSLAIYAFFVVPVFNLLVPAAVFLALHISYHRIKKKDTNGGLSVVPVYIGLVLLLVVNVVFLVDIELMVHWAKRHQESPTEESEWTFGQTLAILLLILPLRDVFMFIVHVRTLKRHEKRHEKYTQELKDALENCDMHKVKRAVKHADIRVEALGSFPTALQFAAYHGELELVRSLMRKGANINTEGGKHGSALVAAVSNGKDDVATCLLDAGAFVDLQDPIIFIGAASTGLIKTVRWLLNHDANIETTDINGNTALHLAAESGDEHILKMLLDHDGGPIIDETRRFRQTPLDLTGGQDHIFIVKTVVDAGVNIETPNATGRTPLHLAAKNGHLHIVKMLLDYGARIDPFEGFGQTPLSFAVENNHEHIVKVLLQEGVDINAANHAGCTPLHLAVSHGHESLMRILLESGAKFESAPDNGRKLLHWAAKSGHMRITQLLLADGADVGATNDNGSTSLYMAVSNGHLQVVQILLDGGANVETADHSGRTPLHLAAENNQGPIVKTLLDGGANIETADHNGWTPLHLAALRDDCESIVKILLDAGANIEAADNDGQTPLHQAASCDCQSIVKILLDAGANINTADNDGQTPLHQAASCDCQSVVKILLDAGANISIADNNGNTAYHLAARNGHELIVEMFRERGISSGKT